MRDDDATARYRRAQARKKTGSKARRRAAAAPAQPVRKTPTPLSPAQAERVRLMREKGVSITLVADALNEDGISISRQAVSDVVTRGYYVDAPKTKRSRAEQIIAKFCSLTETSRLEAWPDLVHEGDDESDPSVIARINRARGLAAGAAAGEQRDRAVG